MHNFSSWAFTIHLKIGHQYPPLFLWLLCFPPHKKKTKTETKRNKNLQDFSRSEYISFTILIVTLNIMKSDFTSFIEANIYIQTGEHSGVRVICDYCKTQQNPSLEGGSWARQCSLPHNIALTSIHACLLKAC